MKYTITAIAIIAVAAAIIIVRPRMLEYISESRREHSSASFTYNVEPGYNYTFLEFGSEGCQECRKMAIVMEEIRDIRKDINVVFINTMLEENQQITEYFGIVTIPTQVILDKDTKEIMRHNGSISTADLLEAMPPKM